MRGLKDFKFEHPLKHDLSMDRKAGERTILVKDLQLRNDEKLVATTSGAISCTSEELPLKVLSPIVVTFNPVSLSTFERSRVPVPSKYFKSVKFCSFAEIVKPQPVAPFVKIEGEDSGITSHLAHKDVAANRYDIKNIVMLVLIITPFYIPKCKKSNR